MEPVGLPISGTTNSALSHLEGALSGRTYDADHLVGLDPADGKPLLARYDLSNVASTLTAASVARRAVGGLWRWHELLPVRNWEFVVHMGEGSTPLEPARRLGLLLGLSNLLLKRESLNPTGSFKARGMAVAVSRALELGASHLVAPSAGNAGGALAAYAAAAGVSATVVMPSDSPAANQTEVLIAGAHLILLDGLISDCGRLARLIADRSGAFDVSTLKEPYRVEGKKTMGFEIAEQLGWRLPDAIVYPTGGGTGLIGMWKAFDEMQAIGLIGADRPRMYSVQVEGCAPIVRAFAEGKRFADTWDNATTTAAGIRVPSTVGDFLILDCLRESEGAAIAVPERELAGMQGQLAAAGAGYLSLETAAAVAAMPLLLEARRIDRDEVVIVFDTGSGFKSDPPCDLVTTVPVPNDPDRWEGIVSQLVKR
ncbi:MAG TPA: threonine synthase [Chloroflexi bacterium]|jgi:threonine synthase|nr:threonine synthase [Chloroflexota bacterium]